VIQLADVEQRPRRVAIGTFDGVHRGHRAVIGDSDAVLTFEPHPSVIVAPDHAPRLLTPLAVKAALIAGIGGVQELIVIDFDARFAARSPQSFIDDVLVEQLGATDVAVGANFRFGHRAQGDATMLAADPRLRTRIEPLYEVGGEVVSSSQIRRLVLAGAVADAADFLGAPFELRGEVVAGERRGRGLGFPTANIVPDPALVTPAHGIYACRADGRPAAVSIGVRPTFDSRLGELVEAYLLDFDGDLYGHVLRLEFVERLRGELRFESVDDLVTQMHADVARVREICG
jgi:riboflavin kinase/FMN adenylyltransferase